MDNDKKFFAEIVASSLANYTAQCWQWDNLPSFGSLVLVETNEQINFGVVTQIQTGSLDASRYPFAYQKTEEALKVEQPQIFELLKTTFQVQLIGFLDRTESPQILYYQLPIKPCKIHSFVAFASDRLTLDFYSRPDFLYILFGFEQEIPNLDELLLTILKQLSKHKILTPEYIDKFYETLSLLTGNDYKRLKLFLRRAQYLLNI
ncbi:TPA: hypothetical protein DEO28_02625 [Candidatus Dependentiae bacterium]|nr:MAG: HerA-ATP synthase, barrel domain protein [candidate division TM6 bacterium GW2011_GWE2_31_21]KKP53195.1 MAG: HerA-ATP synthase, barrel domain protein [candidate division TM6 bacterium GW2011_GWF2_33_332]HBS48013.1 hypothetical protein [Candidatus Dependentiae bacterium]HBZ73383.1 hypothetical protein [Candidatus Dependentiae bacterium]